MSSLKGGEEVTLRDIRESIVQIVKEGRLRIKSLETLKMWYILATAFETPLTPSILAKILENTDPRTHPPDYRGRILEEIKQHLPSQAPPLTREETIYSKWSEARDAILRSLRLRLLPKSISFSLLDTIGAIALKELNSPPKEVYYRIHLSFTP